MSLQKTLSRLLNIKIGKKAVVHHTALTAEAQLWGLAFALVLGAGGNTQLQDFSFIA